MTPLDPLTITWAESRAPDGCSVRLALASLLVGFAVSFVITAAWHLAS